MSETRGGARDGAGRKVSRAPQIGASGSPEEFLMAVMNDSEIELAKRLNAAELLLRFGGGKSLGKKEVAEELARAASAPNDEWGDDLGRRLN